MLRCSVRCGTKRKNDERMAVKLTGGFPQGAGDDVCEQQ
jgi:hypothetical protein